MSTCGDDPLSSLEQDVPSVHRIIGVTMGDSGCAQIDVEREPGGLIDVRDHGVRGGRTSGGSGWQSE